MKLLFSFIALFPIIISNSAMADRNSFKSSNHLGHQAMYQFLEARMEIENGLKSNDLNIKSKALIACLLAWENSDGIYAFEVPAMFMEVWVSNPVLMSSWFESNETKRDRWFNSQSYIFIMLAHSKGRKFALELRDNIVKALESVKGSSYDKEKFISGYIKVLNLLEFPEI